MSYLLKKPYVKRVPQSFETSPKLENCISFHLFIMNMPLQVSNQVSVDFLHIFF